MITIGFSVVEMTIGLWGELVGEREDSTIRPKLLDLMSSRLVQLHPTSAT